MTTVFLSFQSRDNAEKFVGALVDHGAQPEEISVIEKYAGVPHDATPIEKSAETGITTTTAADFQKGAVIGGGLGLAIGVAAGLASLLVPGIGLVAGAGALANVIVGSATVGASGALVGGIAGYMRDMGVEGEVPDEYERDYADDYVIVAVQPMTLDRTTIANLADKYHATRSTLRGPATVGVPVVETRVEPVATEVAPGVAVVETAVVEETVGVKPVDVIVEKDLEPTRPK